MHVSVQTILFQHICSLLYWLDRKSDFYKEKKIALKYLTWYAMTSLKTNNLMEDMPQKLHCQVGKDHRVINLLNN